jgi:hypothetical protein
MIRFASILVAFWFATSISAAQDGEGWPIEQRCLGDLPYPTIPQNRWTFEGVIFSQNADGVRAIRADVNTSYFVALDSESSFAFDGAFSPDGRWFAYPKGSTSYNNMISNFIGVGEIEVVSTDPRRQSYSIPWGLSTFSGVTRNLPLIYWVDNSSFMYDGLFERNGEIHGGGGIIYPFTGEMIPWDNEMPLYQLGRFSPDSTRAFYFDDQQWVLKLYDVENEMTLTTLAASEPPMVWLPDSSGFVTEVPANPEEVNPIESTLTLFSRDGQPTETISVLGSFGSASPSQDGNKLAFSSANRLFIADLESRSVTDLCFEMKSHHFERGIAWSPDNSHLVFTYDSHPIIVNTDTLEMQILRYETGEILGWYPLD